jgi:putative flippase GtrA
MSDRMNPVEAAPAQGKNALHRQFLRFAAVGVVGTAAHYGVI